MGRPLRTVPWADAAEFELVYSCLYSENPQVQLYGVKRVKAWASRAKVPHAVDSTATFVEIQLRDEASAISVAPARIASVSEDSPFVNVSGVVPPSSEHELRLSYALAFIRFVNGLVDAGQKGVYAQSVASLAEQMGLPSWFVELRHAATHDSLPTLSLLRSGCVQALQWLEVRYWLKQKNLVEGAEASIRELLGTFARSFENPDMETKNQSEKGVDPRIVEIASIVTSDTYLDILIPILLESAFLLKKYTAQAQEPPKYWVDAVVLFSRKWDGFLEDLLFALLDRLCSPSPNGDTSSWEDDPTGYPEIELESIVRWAKQLLRIMLRGWDGEALVGGTLTKRSNAFFWEVAERCLQSPDTRTLSILKELVELHPDIKLRLQPLHNYLEQTMSSSSRKDKQGKEKLRLNASEVKVSKKSISDERSQLEDRVKKILFAKNRRIDSASTVSNEVLISNEATSTWTRLSTARGWRPSPLGCLSGTSTIPDLQLAEIPDSLDKGYEGAMATIGVLQYPVSGAIPTPHRPIPPNPPRFVLVAKSAATSRGLARVREVANEEQQELFEDEENSEVTMQIKRKWEEVKLSDEIILEVGKQARLL